MNAWIVVDAKTVDKYWTICSLSNDRFYTWRLWVKTNILNASNLFKVFDTNWEILSVIKTWINFPFSSFQTQMRCNSNSNKLTILLAVISLLAQGIHAKLNFCDVETGQTNIILDIEESRGDRKYSLLDDSPYNQDQGVFKNNVRRLSGRANGGG